MIDRTQAGLPRPVLATLALLALSACQTPAALPPGAADSYIHKYRNLPHYRAYAVGDPTISWAVGWSSGHPSVRAAINGALNTCGSGTTRVTANWCSVYAIGDLIVKGMSPTEREQAIQFYQRDPSATKEKFDAYLQGIGGKRAVN